MKIRAFLLAVCGIIMPALANAGETAFDFEVDGLRYEKTSESTVMVVGPGSDFRAGDLVIPAKIEADGNTYQVTAVGGTGFWGWAVSEKTPAITSVTLPEGLEVIESGAFSFCSFSGKTRTEGRGDSVNRKGDRGQPVRHEQPDNQYSRRRRQPQL